MSAPNLPNAALRTLKLLGWLGAILAVMLCYAQVRTKKKVVIEVNIDANLAPVVSLVDRYKERRDTNVLVQLAALVLQPKFGANAAASMSTLRPGLTETEIRTIVMPALIQGLETPHPAIRRQCAISIVGEFAEFAEPAVSVLARLAAEPGEAVNAAPFAAEALGKLGARSKSAIPSLVKVLNRPDTESGGFEDASVRVRAAEAIGRIGISGAEAARAIELGLLDRNEYVRAMSAQALLRKGFDAEAAIKTLAELMMSHEVGIRRFAFHVLEDLSAIPEPLVEHLRNGLNDSDHEIASTARLLLDRSSR